MKNLEKRTLSRLFSMLLATAIVLGSFATVMAEPTKDPTINGDGTSDATLALTKNYLVPAGVTLPAADFGFSFTKDGIVTGSSAYNSTVSADTSQPDLLGIDGDKDISYAAKLSKSGTADGKDIYVKQISNIVPAGTAFSHAGEYVYTITEVASTNASLDDAMTYSQAEYKMHVFVKNNSGALLVSAVVVYQTKNDKGETGTNAKVNLDDSTLLEGYGNDFAFTNLYAPTDEVLSISKTVQGDYADMTKEFSMSITLNKPTTYTSTTFSAAIVDSTTDKPVNTTLQSFSNGTAKSVTLKTGQELVFVKSGTTLNKDTAIKADDTACMPAGLSYSVVETAVTDYTPKAVVTHGGVADSEITGTAGDDFTVNTNTIVDLGSNIAALKSEYHSITATGYIVRILPAVIMVLMAIAAFAIIMNSRRKEA